VLLKQNKLLNIQTAESTAETNAESTASGSNAIGAYLSVFLPTPLLDLPLPLFARSYASYASTRPSIGSKEGCACHIHPACAYTLPCYTTYLTMMPTLGSMR